jgi:hypothetical protein
MGVVCAISFILKTWGCFQRLGLWGGEGGQTESLPYLVRFQYEKSRLVWTR